MLRREHAHITLGRRQLKTLSTIDKRGSKLIETVFLIAICHHTGDKWQSITLFLSIFYLRSSIVLAFLIAAYPVCIRSLIRAFAACIYMEEDEGSDKF